MSGLVAVGWGQTTASLPQAVRVLDEDIAVRVAAMLDAAIARARRTEVPTEVDLDALVERARHDAARGVPPPPSGPAPTAW